ncbi:hypothetical protein Isop_3635 [Isosphaera pallida ATCC 43644]|uniref:Uncharacterized protein n=1 Tax=Isosphaera pallida (strain ATCC 43644 / DSM 9630 / IS1B) TaxID=575540 RepID=E8QYK9_ISOPI|nr:hypothetical protein [Isosphaera pallida]ADV64192.1 hypothetical protein Isop_3635 [Isosphaera pallida ATCC 43644]
MPDSDVSFESECETNHAAADHGSCCGESKPTSDFHHETADVKPTVSGSQTPPVDFSACDDDSSSAHADADRSASRSPRVNKYRQALAILNQARDVMVESLADEILDNADEFAEGGFLFHEFLESRGPRFQFLGIVGGFLEYAAEQFDDQWNVSQPLPTRRRRRRSRAGVESPIDGAGEES